MEQRALIASAVVLGCVTAAGAGGYVAVRQLSPSTSAPVTETEIATTEADVTEAADPLADPLAGTVADILPTDSGSRAEPEPKAPAVPTPTAVAAPARVERPTARAVERPAPVAAPAPAPVAAPAPRAARPQAAPVRSTPTTTGTRVEPAPPASTAPISESQTASTRPRETSGATDTWPSRDSGARDSGAASTDTWPSRDTGTDTTSAADASLPSRSPVNDSPAPAVPARRMETVTIPADAVINVQLETSLSTTSARVEDVVRARITRDVVSGGDVIIPAGARLLGNVTVVDEGGRVKERSRLGLRFHTLVLADGSEVKLPTETIYREGESPAKGSAAKIGGAAIGGAILGALMGGGKGAVIGAATGAGSGTGWAMAGDRRPAELRSGQALAVRVSDRVTTEIQR